MRFGDTGEAFVYTTSIARIVMDTADYVDGLVEGDVLNQRTDDIRGGPVAAAVTGGDIDPKSQGQPCAFVGRQVAEQRRSDRLGTRRGAHIGAIHQGTDTAGACVREAIQPMPSNGLSSMSAQSLRPWR